MIWTYAYSVVSILVPGSFTVMGGDVGALRLGGKDSLDAIYYSFVTMTTLGYGDVAPVSAPARALAVLQALTGQLYLAVLVARLVALHIAHSTSGIDQCYASTTSRTSSPILE